LGLGAIGGTIGEVGITGNARTVGILLSSPHRGTIPDGGDQDRARMVRRHGEGATR
jgi:hypothetical protein